MLSEEILSTDIDRNVVNSGGTHLYLRRGGVGGRMEAITPICEGWA